MVEEAKMEVDDKSDIIMSLFIRGVKMERQLGIAIVSMAERKFSVSEFVDNEFFSNLENIILQIKTNEQESNTKFKLISPLVAFSHLSEKLRDLYSECEIQNTEVNAEDYTTVNISQSLKTLLNPKAKFLLNESEMDVALSALAGAIANMRLLGDTTNHQQFTIETYKHTQFMRLDVAATRALNVFPYKFGGGIAANSAMNPFGKSLCVDSIFSLLNKCKTKVGTRLLKKWLMQPLQDLKEIETRLILVDFLKEHRLVRQTIQGEYLRVLPDIEVLYTRFYKVKAKKRHSSSLGECVKAYHMVQALKKLAKYMTEEPDCTTNSIVAERYTNKIVKWCKDYAKLEDLVRLSIDFEKVSHHEYVISPQFSPGLQTLQAKN